MLKEAMTEENKIILELNKWCKEKNIKIYSTGDGFNIKCMGQVLFSTQIWNEVMEYLFSLKKSEMNNARGL